MLEADHVTISGDVTFGKGVTLKGTVIIIANHGDRLDWFILFITNSWFKNRYTGRDYAGK